MILNSFILAASIAGLLWSANRMLDGALGLSHRFHISTVVVGLIVGFITSAPELVVSAFAAGGGNPRLGIGNALGSNIANLGLVLGLGAVLTSITMNKKTLFVQFIMLGGALGVLGLLLMDMYLQRYDGIILIILLLPTLIYIARIAPTVIPVQVSQSSTWQYQLPIGFIILLIASHYTVTSAVHIAQMLGIDEVLIGLSVIAIGTSLPELAIVIVSVWKKHFEIALGNILGSNLFNTLGVIGATALIHPFAVDHTIIERDFLLGVALSLLLFLLLFIKPKLMVNRWKGTLLLLCFGAYMVLLYQSGLDMTRQ